jgi:hypothetical protein
MQSKKILVACLSLLLVGLSLSTYNIPRAHAFLANNGSSVTITGLALTGYRDNIITGGSSVDVASSGATVTFNVVLFADNPTTAYQRNVTVGVKFDWMSAYQNASNAGSTNTLTMTANQESSVSISVAVLSTTGTISHFWKLLIGDGPQNKAIPPTCAGTDGSGNVCLISNAGPLQIWSGDQIGAAQAKFQASTQAANVNTALLDIRAISLAGTNPGLTNAAGQLAQASTESSLGDQSWQNGDYSGAKSHYQNSLNDANAASSALTSGGGGADTASITNQILNGVGIALFGIGSLLAGIGGFFYLRRKPKA